MDGVIDAAELLDELLDEGHGLELDVGLALFHSQVDLASKCQFLYAYQSRTKMVARSEVIDHQGNCVANRVSRGTHVVAAASLRVRSQHLESLL